MGGSNLRVVEVKLLGGGRIEMGRRAAPCGLRFVSGGGSHPSLLPHHPSPRSQGAQERHPARAHARARTRALRLRRAEPQGCGLRGRRDCRLYLLLPRRTGEPQACGGRAGRREALAGFPRSGGLAPLRVDPQRQVAINAGSLIAWTKGFSSTGAVDVDVVGLLTDACKRKGVRPRLTALVNDTVGTLMARAYSDRKCSVGVILGTGTNAAYGECECVCVWGGVQWRGDRRRSAPLQLSARRASASGLAPSPSTWSSTVRGEAAAGRARRFATSASNAPNSPPPPLRAVEWGAFGSGTAFSLLPFHRCGVPLLRALWCEDERGGALASLQCCCPLRRGAPDTCVCSSCALQR